MQEMKNLKGLKISSDVWKAPPSWGRGWGGASAITF